MILKPLRPETIRTDMGDYVLSVRGLQARGAAASFDVDLKRGGIAVLDGAGASVALSALAGITRATGSVRYLGYEVAGRSARRLAQSGMLLAGRPAPFRGMTVLEDAMVGALIRTRSTAKAAAAALEWLEIFGLADRRGQRADALAAAEARTLSIVRALAAKPLVLLLDGGIDAAGSEAIRARGTAILVAEPDAPRD